MKGLPANRRVAAPRAPIVSAPQEASPALDPVSRAPSRRPASLRAPWLSFGGVARGGRVALGVAMFVATVFGSAFGLYRYVRTSARFAIKHLVVEGGRRRSEAELCAAAGIAPGANVFSFDPESARVALAQDPWVERARVTRKLPGTVHIEVTEREAIALVSLGQALYVAGPAGTIFKRYEPGDPSDLVVFTGLDEVAERDGRDGLIALVKIAQEVVRDYDRAGPSKRFPLEEVHVDDDGGLTLTVGRDGVRLALGRSPYRAKLERASRVLAEIDRRKGQPTMVFLDNDAHPERVVARMR